LELLEANPNPMVVTPNGVAEDEDEEDTPVFTLSCDIDHLGQYEKTVI
jgi:hypothetical protein